MSHAPVSPQPDAAPDVQTPPNLTDGRTIVQAPGKRGSTVDRTIVQTTSPTRVSTPDATSFQAKPPFAANQSAANQPAANQPAANQPAANQPAADQQQQRKEQSPFNPMQIGNLERLPDWQEWNRIIHSLDQPATWARLFSYHPRLKGLVPIGMGFLAGLMMMGGLFFYFRSYWRTHQPQNKQTLEREYNSQKVAQSDTSRF